MNESGDSHMKSLSKALGCLLLLHGTVGADEPAPWLYAADTAANVIYGFPAEGLGKAPAVPISGRIAITADWGAYLNEDEVLFVPTSYPKVVHLGLKEGSLEEVASTSGLIVGFTADPDELGATALCAGPAHAMSLLSIRRAETGWTTTTVAAPAGLLVAPLRSSTGEWFCIIDTSTHIEDRTEVGVISAAGSYSVIETVTGKFRSLAATPDGKFAIFGKDLPARVYSTDAYERPLGLNAAIESDYIETIQLGKAPVAGAVVGSEYFGGGKLHIQDTESTSSLSSVPLPYDDGGYPTEPTDARSLRAESATRWAYHDHALGTLNHFDAKTKKVSSYFKFHRGEGPDFENILAIDAGSDGLLYILDKGRSGPRILSVNPSTGNRAVVAEVGLSGLAATISFLAPGRFGLAQQLSGNSAALVLVTGTQTILPLVEVGSTQTFGTLQLQGGAISDVEVDSHGSALLLTPGEAGPSVNRLSMTGSESGPPLIQPTFQAGAWDPPSGPRAAYVAEYTTEVAPKLVSAFLVRNRPGYNGSARYEYFGYPVITQPTGTTLTIPNWLLDVPNFPPVSITFRTFSRIESPGAGIWKVRIPTVFSANTNPGNEIFPLILELNPLSGAQAIVKDSAKPTFVRRAGKGLVTLTADLQDIESARPLSFGVLDSDELLSASDFITTPDADSIVAIQGNGWKFFSIDPVTGTVTLLGAGVPNIVDPRLAGLSEHPWVEATFGRAPAELFQTGWLLE